MNQTPIGGAVSPKVLEKQLWYTIFMESKPQSVHIWYAGQVWYVDS